MTDENIDKIDEVEPALSPLAKCEAEAAECKAGWQRAVADYKNLQREVLSRQGEWAQLSERKILEEFIPVYDHLKLSLQGTSSKDQGKSDPWIEGVKYVLKQFADILKSHGVEEIKTAGETFDPRFHESAGEEEGGEAGKILREVSGGYKMGERVIKPARVIISK
ncbi:MAG: nucleotide exchange factor GrpE [Patescibacteria group bacterium]